MTRQEILIDFIKSNNFRTVAEVGVAEGWTAEPIMQECDLDLYVMVEQNMVECNAVLYDVMKRTDVPGDRNISQKPAALMRMDSVSAAKYIANGSLDLVFIDAEHSYAACKEDIIAWLPKVRIGGIICGHDYDPARDSVDVVRAVRDVLGDVGQVRDSAGGDNNHVWWVRVDEPLLRRVLPEQAVASDSVVVEARAIDTFFDLYPLLQGFSKSWSWLTDVNHANPFYSPLYYILCRHIGAKYILEVGCEQGYSAYMLAMAAKENDGVYYCVEKSSSFANQLKAGLAEEGFPHVLIWADSKDIEEFTWAPRLDFVLLDGEHSMEAIENEFEWVYPKLRPGGYVALHDIYAWSSEGFHTLVHNPEYNFEYLTIPHNYGLALLRKREDNWDETLQMHAAQDSNKEPGPGWMYTGLSPADGRVVVISSTVSDIPVESTLHIPTERPKRPDAVLQEESLEAPQVAEEEGHVLRIAADGARTKVDPLEPVEPSDLEGVPKNLKEYVAKLGQRDLDL